MTDKEPAEDDPGMPEFDTPDLWALIDTMVAEIPESEWRKIPPDLSENLDKYLNEDINK